MAASSTQPPPAPTCALSPSPFPLSLLFETPTPQFTHPTTPWLVCILILVSAYTITSYTRWARMMDNMRERVKALRDAQLEHESDLKVQKEELEAITRVAVERDAELTELKKKVRDTRRDAEELERDRDEWEAELSRVQSLLAKRTKQLESLSSQAEPFLHILHINLDLDLPGGASTAPTSPAMITDSAHSDLTSSPTSMTFPTFKPQPEPSDDMVVSLLRALNADISSLSVDLAAEGVKVVKEVETALKDADSWIDAMLQEESSPPPDAFSDGEPSSKSKKSKKAKKGKGDKKSPKQQKAPEQRTNGHPHAHPYGQFFPERRLTDSPASLHEVELSPGPPPSAPLPPIPSQFRSPSPGAAPQAASAPPSRSVPSRSQTQTLQPRSAPVGLGIAGVTGASGQRPQQEQQQQRPPQYMYPYPYSNQQQPMGIPVSLSSNYAPQRSSTLGSVSSSGSGLGMVPFPSSSNTTAYTASPKQTKLAEQDLASLGPYDRQVAIQSQREAQRQQRIEEKKRLKKERRESDKERREREKAEQGRLREEAEEASGQAGEVFGAGLVGMLGEAGVTVPSSSISGSGGRKGAKGGEAVDAGRERLRLALELAFRSALCAYTHWMICSWFFEDERGGLASSAGSPHADGGGGIGDGGEGLEGLLGEVYARVREGEEQFVSGLWRALTRKHVQRMLPGASPSSSASNSKKPSKDDDGGDGYERDAIEEEEEEEGQDELIEELCVYIIDALVNVLIVAGAHGGWYVGGLDTGKEGNSPLEEDGQDDEDLDEDLLDVDLGSPDQAQDPIGGAYSDLGLDFDTDVYRDPYEGISISQLSEFLTVTPTADTFKIGGSPGKGHVEPGLAPSSSSQSGSDQKHSRPSSRTAERPSREQAHFEATRRYTHTHLHALLTSVFKAPLVRILKEAKVLNKVLGEGVVRCDLEALYVGPGVVFERGMMEKASLGIVPKLARAEEISDEGGAEEVDGDETPRPGGSPSANRGSSQYQGAKASPQEVSHPEDPPPGQGNLEEDGEDEILCTTELGLVRAEKVPRTRGEWDELVLLKPRVVLMRDLQ
ncbi:hypothetical protein D9611_003555 [Ephemerocybe angulata]|uniref:Uncharacterized protein n=1 Tax=Ephemerocybe angulata TaxID=980116 RepID=A0A8H5B6A1_9AGAR|nr:hypothetical protein D9611_003555 [Tulosesus angulatus]